MKRETVFGILFLFAAFHSEGSSLRDANRLEGVEYRHKIQSSRFNVGAGGRSELDARYERIVGDKGAFLVDQRTGASLAVRNAPRAGGFPQPLTQDAAEHSARVREYLLAAGIPADEVSGTHVTTTMAGGGPTSGGVQPSRSKLLWYTTHLERSLGGIPVETSFAYAALDSAGESISEGVYWPAIPTAVVEGARALNAKLASADERSAFLASVRAVRSDVADGSGEVKIVHSSAGHDGPFEAKAVYEVVVRSPNGGKAQLMWFDDAGAQVVLADQRPSGKDSPKSR
jgi:hypothetical protein